MLIGNDLFEFIKKKLISKNYILVHLCGGLGNQMFQYSFARALCAVRNADLFIDISAYEYDSKRKYQLDFYINKNNGILLKNKLVDNFYIKFIKLINKLFYNRDHINIIDDELNFNNEVVKIDKNIGLFGYWQNENYFLNFEDLIRNDYTIPINGYQNEALLKNEIANSNSIAVHIRRGDYISDPDAKEFQGALGLNYYTNAINYFSNKIPDAHFYFFSDDIDYVKNQFKSNAKYHFVNCSKSLNDFQEMCLMRLCKHFIIANSSFSWWAAWLGDYQSKVIVAPKVWFASQPSFDRICPENWIRM